MNLRQRQNQRDVRWEFEKLAVKKYKLTTQDLERSSEGNYRKSNINHLWLGFKLYHETAEQEIFDYGKGTFVISRVQQGGKFDFRPSPRIHPHWDKGSGEMQRLHALSGETFSLWRLVGIVRGPKDPKVKVGEFFDNMIAPDITKPKLLSPGITVVTQDS